MEKGREKKNPYEEQPDFSNGEKSKIMQHFAKGMTAFLVVAASVVFYFAFLRFDRIYAVVSKIWQILLPIIYGLAFAYLLNPMVNFVEQKLNKIKRMQKFSRIIGIFAALLVVIAIVVALCNMLLPELYNSVRNLVLTIPGQIDDFLTWLNKIFVDNTTLDMMFKSAVQQGGDMLENWLQTDLLKQTNDLVIGVTGGVVSVVGGIADILIGLIISVYVLYSKEKFAKQSKKLIYACMKTRRANIVLHIGKKAHAIFGGFLVGKIIDSGIIGVLCFIGLTILKMPYALLISVIVGVTNIIPFFGPFIGAIPSAILILLTDPMKGLYFLIFILVLQQVDGNIIGPKILGESTGLSAFWVIFSILLGGGLFGFVGMIMGVPTFALFYYIVQTLVEQKLKKKKLPAETDCYTYNSYVDDNGIYRKAEEGDN